MYDLPDSSPLAECQQAFEEIKGMFVSPAVHTYMSFTFDVLRPARNQQTERCSHKFTSYTQNGDAQVTRSAGHAPIAGECLGRANLTESLEVGPAQGNAALLALHILHLVVTSGQVSHCHLASPAHSTCLVMKHSQQWASVIKPTRQV